EAAFEEVLERPSLHDADDEIANLLALDRRLRWTARLGELDLDLLEESRRPQPTKGAAHAVAAIRVAAFDEAHVANEGLERLALAIDPHSPDPNLRPRLAGDEKGDVGAGCPLWWIRHLRPSLDLGERIAVSRVEIEDHAAGLVLETV